MSIDHIARILVAVADPSESRQKAIRRAAALASSTGATVELFNAIPSTLSSGIAHAEAEQFTRYVADQSLRQLERTANRLRREDIVVETTVQTGFPVHQAILRRARQTKADLVVIEAHKHNLFARLLLTQTDFELIRHCPVPLLIVKGTAAWRHPRILAALDPFHANDKPSELDGEIVAAAHALANAVHGAVHAAHIFQSLPGTVLPMPVAPTVIAASPAQERAYRTAMRRRFHEATDRHEIARGKSHLVCGDPAVELPRLARSLRAGLVVMGAASRSGLKRIFIGNTAERVLDSLQCDVLVVKSPS
jgi:universal stress protein E